MATTMERPSEGNERKHGGDHDGSEHELRQVVKDTREEQEGESHHKRDDDA